MTDENGNRNLGFNYCTVKTKECDRYILEKRWLQMVYEKMQQFQSVCLEKNQYNLISWAHPKSTVTRLSLINTLKIF